MAVLRPVVAAALVAAAGVAPFATACKYDWPLLPDGGEADATGADVAIADAAAPFTCDGALFCDSFDDTPLAQHWADLFTGTQGTLRIEPLATAPSPPDVLFAARPLDGGNPNTAYATTVLTTPITHAAMSFMIRPEVVDPTFKACVAGFIFNENGDSHLVRLFVGGGKATVQEKIATVTSYDLPSAPPIGKWSHMTMSIDVPGHIRVTMEGVVLLDHAADPSWVKSTSTRIFVGINFLDQPGTAFAFHFDDFRFDGF